MKFGSLCLAAAVAVVLLAQPANADVNFTEDPIASSVFSGGKGTFTFSFTATSPGGVIAGFTGNLAGHNAFSPIYPDVGFHQQLVGGAICGH
jgi:hypothetical protein